ncbi:hypothetical protein EGW08_008955 [Elysia chlorotica]|uniref:Bile salt export pump n=1 Tax=Elysia chlorotica TaxID=188477 RepID=A0A433TNY0_ELYCH|nr:hypothetical protein EGW08_008955 [Elysia chlorotica]
MTRKKYDFEPTFAKGIKSDVVHQADIVPEVAFNDDEVHKQNGATRELSQNGNTKVPRDAEDGQEQSHDERPKASGRFGFVRKGDKQEMVGTLELFQFSTKFDIFLIIIGVLGSIIAGAVFIGNITILGEVVNIFTEGNSSSLNTNSTENEETDYLGEIMPYIYAYIIAGCISILSVLISISCWTWSAERQVATMRKRFFLSVMSQDIGWFDLHGSGDITSMFSEDMSKVQEGLGDKTGIFIQWTCTWLAAIIMTFTRSWKLTLFALPFSPITMFVGLTLFRTMRRMAAREAKAYAKAGAVAEQAFRAIRTVQAFQGQEKESERYQGHLGAAMDMASKKGLVIGLANSSLWVIVYVMFAGVMWFGLWLIQNDGLEPGSILQVFFGVLIGSVSLGNAFNNLESMSNARGAAVRVFKIIQQGSSINAFSSDGLRPDKLQGSIEFRHVAFSYPARSDVQVTKDLTFKVNPGQHVALVGPSGCGKSTAIQLLQRFYDPLAGEILVDGRNIKDLNLKWLRGQIGVVSQEPVLFDASIEENIRLGNVSATIEEVEAAAKMANAHDFIKSLPMGYKTNVGERGAQLSGGQKQRISIARALVRNPKILLLDEATSALDHEGEAVVQAALEKAGKGRTTITIAHRLSTIKHADKILAISDGEVVEEGTHDSLLQSEGLYYQLVQIQTQIVKESDLDISDVVIVEDTDELSVHDSLLGASFRRTRSNGSTAETNLVVRSSRRQSQISARSGAEPLSEVQETLPEPEEESLAVGLFDIIRYNAPEWHLILIGSVTAIIAGLIQPGFSFLISELIKTFELTDRGKQRDRVNILGTIILCIAVLVAVVRVLMNYCISKSGAYLTARLRRLTFESIINQDMEYFDSPYNQVGSITSRLSGDASLVQGATGAKVGQILESLSTIVCALVISFVYGWKLAFVVLSFMPLMVISGLIQGKVMAGAAHKEKSQLQQASRMCSESVDNIRTVASLGREDFFVDKFDHLIEANKRSHRVKSVVFGAAYGIANSVLFFAYAGSFYYGAVLIDDGEMEFYDVFRVFGAIIFGGMVVGRNSSFGVDYVKAKLAAGRIISLINRKPKVDVRDPSGEKLDNIAGGLSLEDVVFHYVSRPNQRVLYKLRLPILPGQTVALVGASGCGKSTTAQLLQRFYEIDSGALMVEGHDLKQLNLRWYRQQIGVVSQEPMLFDYSIAENIAYGDNSRQVPMAEIIEAAKQANIHNFISSLPKGYDTNVGEKGAQLSGGQKQRIAIARALVRNPKILILDEATSALDTESEKIVQDALDRASQNRTCITIAHRLSTVQKADKIAVVSKGRILESGTHKELLTIKGAYYRLQKAQGKRHHRDSDE